MVFSFLRMRNAKFAFLSFLAYEIEKDVVII